MPRVSVIVRQPVRATPEQTFEGIVPIKLESIFTGYGPLPAVIGTRDQVGDWRTPGNTRTVLLKGGGTMSERIDRVDFPSAFEYTVTPEDGPLKHLVDHIEGSFRFEAAAGGGCSIRWTYAFVPKPGRRAFVLLLAPLWRRYATRTMVAGAAIVETGH